MRRRMWSDRVWPVLVGTLVGVGLTGAGSAYGLAGLLLGFAILAPLGLVVFWGLADELGIDHARAVRLGLGSAVGVLVLLGLTGLFPTYGLVIAAAVVLGSPTSLGLISRFRRSSLRRSVASELVDPVVLNSRFDEIVTRLRDADQDGRP